MSNPSTNRNEKKAIAHKHANRNESATQEQLSIYSVSGVQTPDSPAHAGNYVIIIL